MELYIIRHGITDWNRKRIMQGRTDIPLNDEGRRMALEAAEEYADIHFDVCYTSPLVRAEETAEIIMKGRNVPVIKDERLIEMNFGEYEGTGIDEHPYDSPIRMFFRCPEKFSPDRNAESFEELNKRTGDFLKKTVFSRENENNSILIVGHGAMNCSIISQIKNLPPEEFWSYGIQNCKLIKLI